MPSPIAVNVGTKIAQVWSGRSTPGINTLLLMNTDTSNTVLVGSDITSLVVPIAPNGSLSVDPTSNWYVVGLVAGNAPLVVVPNGQSNFLGLTQGLGNLAIPAIKSPNFVHNVSGWAVNKDGSAEFNNLAIRGTFTGNNYIINAAGEFYYSGTPALGNLLYSIANGSGTDTVGNTYLQGFAQYFPGAGSTTLGVTFTNGEISTFVKTGGGGTWSLVSTATAIFNASGVFINGVIAQISETAGTATIQCQTNQISLGNPVAGNAVVIDTLNGTLGIPLEVAAPAAPASGYKNWADTSGFANTTLSADSQSYKVGHRTLVLASNTPVASGGGTSIFTTQIGTGTYRIKGKIFASISGAAQQLSLGIGVPGGSAGVIAVNLGRAAVVIAITEFASNALTAIGAAASLAAGNTYVCDIDAVIPNTGVGNMVVTCAATNAGDITIASNSFIDIIPV